MFDGANDISLLGAQLDKIIGNDDLYIIGSSLSIGISVFAVAEGGVYGRKGDSVVGAILDVKVGSDNGINEGASLNGITPLIVGVDGENGFTSSTNM